MFSIHFKVNMRKTSYMTRKDTMLYFSGTIWCMASLFSTILSGHFYLSKVTFTFQILTSQRHMLFCTVIVVRIISKTHGLKKV